MRTGAIALLVLGLPGCSASPQPAPPKQSTHAAALDASKLVLDYQYDAYAAGNQYEGRPLSITGDVRSNRGKTLKLATGDRPEVLTARLVTPVKVARGKTVAIRCASIAPTLHDVIVDGCRLLAIADW